MTENAYEEKRGFVRMRIDTLVTFTIKGNDSQCYHGNSYDLSATGLKMTTEDKPNVGDEIELIMNSGDHKLPPFIAEGKVVRCDVDSSNSALYHVSIELTKTQ